MTIQDTMQTAALRRVIGEAGRAKRDVVEALDQLNEVLWPQQTEAVGDTLTKVERALCTLSSRLSRIEIAAEDGIPPYDEDAELDALVAGHLAARKGELGE